VATNRVIAFACAVDKALLSLLHAESTSATAVIMLSAAPNRLSVTTKRKRRTAKSP
jgi:hypothetical protein